MLNVKRSTAWIIFEAASVVCVVVEVIFHHYMNKIQFIHFNFRNIILICRLMKQLCVGHMTFANLDRTFFRVCKLRYFNVST